MEIVVKTSPGCQCLSNNMSYRSSATKIRRLKEENESLRQKLEEYKSLGVGPDQQRLSPQVQMPPEVFPPEDVFDDFAIIAMQEAPAAKEDAGKSLKSFLRNITGGGSTPNTRLVKVS